MRKVFFNIAKSFKISIILILIFSITFLFFINTSFSQTGSSNLEKLNLPFKVDFSTAELQLLNSLTQVELEKLIRLVKLVLEDRNKRSQAQFQDLTRNQNFNSNTGQFQSNSPQSNNSSSGFSGGSNFQGNSQNPYSNNLPFSGESGNQNSNFSQNQRFGINPRNDEGLDVDEIDPMCIPNYGIDHRSASGCSSIEGLNPRVKRITMEACTLIKQPIPVNSAYRSPECNRTVGGAENSNHMRGIAIDVSLGTLGSRAQTVVLKFRQAGLVGFRCYGPTGHTHFSLSSTERDDLSKCPPIVRMIYGN